MPAIRPDAHPAPSPASPPVQATGLARGSISVRQIVFQSVAFMGPGATIVSSLPLAMAFAGGAAVTACLIALAVLLLVASSVAQLAKHLPSAGSFATFASNGLHPTVGFVVGWLYALLTNLVAPLLTLIWASLLSSATGAPDLWWLWALGLIVVIGAINLRGVHESSLVNLIFGLTEIVLFAGLSIWIVIAAGSTNTLAVFGTEFANVPGYTGIAGIIAGATYCILAFSGFEAAAPLAEETENPKKSIPRAVMLSLLGIGVLEIFAVYAATVAWGPDDAAGFASITGSIGEGWQVIADRVLPIGALLVLIAVAVSCFANANAGVNSATRTLFALGRVKILPGALAQVDSRRSPRTAVVAQIVVTLIFTFGLGFAFGPGTAFGIIGTAITLAFVLIYMTVHLSCLGYFLRKRRSELNVWLHVVIPVVGFILLIPALLVALGAKVVDFISPIEAPLSYGAFAVWAWILIGVAYLVVTRLRTPAKIGLMSSVMEDVDDSDVAPPTRPTETR
ncbi:APC family permease [Herbiconiux sp. KACC 21604]|uniref:APC family permease n=1 Tax=unclassified Herbiconiux TaxID=2618217 RepID=UPI001492FFA2|nr:APC family permease [Herbiconiux sp. SALV-R1]QJU55288.1 APC family permease [Herbiconiux sp. SALV-R1]WPO86455.1 APC family permease [Herbiconiux sp. KACC 21604]